MAIADPTGTLKKLVPYNFLASCFEFFLMRYPIQKRSYRGPQHAGARHQIVIESGATILISGQRCSPGSEISIVSPRISPDFLDDGRIGRPRFRPRAIPIVQPEAVQSIGLVVPKREPMTPATAALVAEAQRIAPTLDA